MMPSMKIKKFILKFSSRILKPLFIIILIILIWETSARFGLLNVKVLSSPSEIINSFLQLISTRVLLTDTLSSIRHVLIGFFFGSIVGIFVAIFFGLSKVAHDYFGFIIEILRPIPPIAWIPIAILWFGLGDKPAYYLVGLGTFFPVFTNTLKAIKGIESIYIDLARSLGATKSKILRKVLIPILLPDLITGLRVGLGVGWIIVITAEMVGAQSGLGYMIQLNRIMLQMPNVIVGMITIGLTGLILSLVINLIEAFLIPWRKKMATIEQRGKI